MPEPFNETVQCSLLLDKPGNLPGEYLPIGASFRAHFLAVGSGFGTQFLAVFPYFGAHVALSHENDAREGYPYRQDRDRLLRQ